MTLHTFATNLGYMAAALFAVVWLHGAWRKLRNGKRPHGPEE